MEPSGVTLLLLLLVGPLSFVTAGGCIRTLFRLCVRRYERSLTDAYTQGLQSRAIEARSFNPNVGYALRRAKQTVDEARKGSPDALHAQAALSQVSLWLDTAAETSDLALRSLERDGQLAGRLQHDLHE